MAVRGDEAGSGPCTEEYVLDLENSIMSKD